MSDTTQLQRRINRAAVPQPALSQHELGAAIAATKPTPPPDPAVEQVRQAVAAAVEAGRTVGRAEGRQEGIAEATPLRRTTTATHQRRQLCATRSLPVVFTVQVYTDEPT